LDSSATAGTLEKLNSKAELGQLDLEFDDGSAETAGSFEEFQKNLEARKAKAMAADDELHFSYDLEKTLT
jgi:hypothetical protein